MASQLPFYFQTSMTVSFSSNPQTMYLVSSTTLTANTLTFLLHPNWKETASFLFDIEITPANGKFSTSIYRKPTFTGLFTNFHSFIPPSYKRSLISCLLHRIFNLCSSYENFHVQLEIVRKLFNLNGFPSHMFDNVVRRFLNNIFKPKPIIHTVPKKNVCQVYQGMLTAN